MSVIQFQPKTPQKPEYFPEKENSAGSEPINLGDRAIDNLRFIRETMERSTSFTAVPGVGGVLMGATALCAAFAAQQQSNFRYWLMIWLAEAVTAFAIGVLTVYLKAKKSDFQLASAPSRKFFNAFFPPIIGGGILTALFYQNSWFEQLPTVWLTLYGIAVVCGGAYSVKIVPVVGWIFIALGVVSVFVAPQHGNLLMALGFGLVQIVFGMIIAHRFGG